MEDESTSERAAAQAAAPVAPVEPVVLYLKPPHVKFDLSGVNLEDLVPEGTAYVPADADVVRMLCFKYGIGYSE